MKRQLFLCFWGLILSFSVYGQSLKAEKIIVPNSQLVNLYQIDAGVFRSEQPSKTDFKALEKYGIREVLNLRQRHNDNDEAAGTTLKLHRIKMRAGGLREEELITALRMIYHRKGPILIHCHHGSDRTGAVCALYRILFQGASKEAAIWEMTQGGFGFHRIYQNIIRRIEEADVERIKRTVVLEVN